MSDDEVPIQPRPEIMSAIAKARNAALRRLHEEHPVRFGQLLREELAERGVIDLPESQLQRIRSSGAGAARKHRPR